jgi:hypothetical protein
MGFKCHRVEKQRDREYRVKSRKITDTEQKYRETKDREKKQKGRKLRAKRKTGEVKELVREILTVLTERKAREKGRRKKKKVFKGTSLFYGKCRPHSRRDTWIRLRELL